MVCSIEKKYVQLMKDDFSNNITLSKRIPNEFETDQGKAFYNSSFQNVINIIKAHYFSRFSDKGPLNAEKFIRTITKWKKYPVIEKRIASCISDLSSVTKKTIVPYITQQKWLPLKHIRK